jgi:hypothetical protein
MYMKYGGLLLLKVHNMMFGGYRVQDLDLDVGCGGGSARGNREDRV